MCSARKAYRPRDMSTDIDSHHWLHWDATSFLSVLGWLRAQVMCCSTWTTWRYEQTRFTNIRRCVSILESKRSWKPRHVVRTFDAHPKLQGRAGAIRTRNWQEDVTAIMYWPPKPKDATSRAAYAETLYGLAEWLRKTLQDTPKRSTFYIMRDLND